jgi:hypothetical protein
VSGREDDEHLIRVARLPDSLRPLGIFAGDPPTPIPCEWLAIARVTFSAADSSYILYFLDAQGAPCECLQYESLRIAMDQAHAICAFPRSGWTVCMLRCRQNGTYDPDQLLQKTGA